MAAITNGSGKNRVAPTIITSGNHTSVSSIDDDERQRPGQIVGFTTQAMIVANLPTSGQGASRGTPFNTIV
jgi:hypothetical protein